MTSYIVNEKDYENTIQLARHILVHVLKLMECNIGNAIEDEDNVMVQMCALDIKQVIRWLHQLHNPSIAAKLNPTIEFPLTIEDATVKVARLRDSYAVIGNEDGAGDLEMAAFHKIRGFREVKEFRVPNMPYTVSLTIDVY